MLVKSNFSKTWSKIAQKAYFRNSSSTINEILKDDNNIMKVERCNITKANNDKKNISYSVILIKLTKPLNSQNNIAFSHLELLNSEIWNIRHKVPTILKLL